MTPLAVRAFLDCMLICMNRTEAPCQNHRGVESIEVLGVAVSSNNANVFFFFFFISVREQLREQTKQYEKSENDLKALQSVGQVSEPSLVVVALIRPSRLITSLY